MRFGRFARAVVICLGSLTGVASAADTCMEPDPVIPTATLTLKRAERTDRGVFVGHFEVRNYTLEMISIPGRKSDGQFRVDYPDAGIEFKDLNGVWRQLLGHAPGTFFSAAGALKIVKNSSALVTIELFSADRVDLSGVEFRAKVRLSAPETCFVSFPFRTYPARVPITRIESVAVPGISPSGGKP
jgi:hypothetical protein